MLGYSALYVDFEKGAGNTLYEYDMPTHGPIIGVTARFGSSRCSESPLSVVDLCSSKTLRRYK
jgi:hypothetical protein